VRIQYFYPSFCFLYFMSLARAELPSDLRAKLVHNGHALIILYGTIAIPHGENQTTYSK
jgi:hypothetical protein